MARVSSLYLHNTLSQSAGDGKLEISDFGGSKQGVKAFAIAHKPFRVRVRIRAKLGNKPKCYKTDHLQHKTQYRNW